MKTIEERINDKLKKLRRLAVALRKKELASKKHKQRFIRMVVEGDSQE